MSIPKILAYYKCFIKVTGSIFLAYLIWLLIRTFIFDYFHVPTNSMSPTIRPGNTVVVNKLLFGPRLYTNFKFEKDGQKLQASRIKGMREIRHNDIVVFNTPVHNEQINFIINDVYCKRVIAIPGDSISAIKGSYINNRYPNCLGNLMQQKTFQFSYEIDKYNPIFREKAIWGNYGWDIKNFGPIYIPAKGDVIIVTPIEANLYKYIIEWELGKSITIDLSSNSVYADDDFLYSHKFSHNYYFMAGDNVSESYDSRFFGLVPEDYIIGIVNMIF